MIAPSLSSILRGFHFLLYLECHIQISVLLPTVGSACYHGNHSAASFTTSLLPPPPSRILSPAASWPLYGLANLPADCRGGKGRGLDADRQPGIRWKRNRAEESEPEDERDDGGACERRESLWGGNKLKLLNWESIVVVDLLLMMGFFCLPCFVLFKRSPV